MPALQTIFVSTADSYSGGPGFKCRHDNEKLMNENVRTLIQDIQVLKQYNITKTTAESFTFFSESPFMTILPLGTIQTQIKSVKVKQSRYTSCRRLGGGDIAPTHSRPRHSIGVVSVTPRPRFSPGKGPPVPLYRWLGGPQSRSGHTGYRKNPLPLPGIEPRSSSL
jgi:hypothetical protein